MRINDPQIAIRNPKRNPKSYPPDAVAFARPMRAARQPLECTGKSPCWVLDGACSLRAYRHVRNLAPRCAGCGGKIRP
jgi:hypothetical protein